MRSNKGEYYTELLRCPDKASVPFRVSPACLHSYAGDYPLDTRCHHKLGVRNTLRSK